MERKRAIGPEGIGVLLQCLGGAAALAAGTARPLMAVIFGGLVNIYNDKGDKSAITHAINRQVLFLVIIFIAQWTLTCAYGILFSISAMRFSLKLRASYFKAAISQDAEKASESRTATDLSTNISVVEDALAEKSGMVLQALSTVVTSLVIAFTRGWQLTLPLLFMVLFLVFSNFGTAAVDAKMEQKIHSMDMQASALAEECLSGIRTITACLATSKMGNRYAAILNKAKAKGFRKSPVRAIQYSVSYFVVLSVYALGFWYGTRLLVQGKINNGGSIVIIILCINQATNAMRLLLPVYSVMAKAKAAYASLSAIIQTEPRIVPSSQGAKMEEIQPRIEFQNVQFSYPSRPSVKVLEGLNLVFEAGKATAVIGPSGSGKSTIVALLERWYDTSDGEIKINGVPIDSYDINSLRRSIRIVPQDAVLFNDTVFNNVSHGLLGTSLQDIPEAEKRELVKKVCKDVQAHEFVEQLPHGYDTLVGSRGSLLSGGQRQRIAIARAIVSSPKILIFDEATSALDGESERLVQLAIDKVSQGRTSIIITHKLATAKGADHIVVLENGKVIDEGRHESLLQTSDTYARIWNAQNLSNGDQSLEKEVKRHSQDDIPSWDSQEKEETIEQTGEDTGKKEPPKMSLLGTTLAVFQSSRTLRYLLSASAVACVLAGAVYPSQAVVFGKDVTSYQEQGSAMTRSINFWSLMFFVIALGSFFAFFIMGTLSSLGGTMTARLYREKYFRALVRQPISFFDSKENGVGLLVAQLSTYPSHLESFVVVLNTLTITVVNLSSVIILGLVVSWRFSVVAIFGSLPVIVLGGYLRVRMSSTRSKSLTEPLMESAQYAAEVIENIKTVNAFSMEDYVCRAMGVKMNQAWRGFYKAVSIGMPLFALSQTGSLLGMALAFWYSGHLLVDGKLNTLQLWIVFLGIVSGSEAAGEFFASANSIVHARNSCAKMSSLIDQPQDKPTSAQEPGEKHPSASIEFDNVCFGYSKNPGRMTLQDVSFHAPHGATIAIVGPSGSGKSTIISLLERFYEATSGEIKIGGTNLSSMNTNSYRSMVSIVSQDTQLFEGTVRDNILLGVEEGPDTEEALIQAARDANIHDFITSLPEGYDTRCGKKGMAFSGGQRQRLAIARALVRDPSILLLDEATSALDSDSEMKIKEALNKAAVGRTTVIVAHRLSTIQNVDKIFVLKRGMVVEQGTHEELKAMRAVYWKMCQMQNIN